MVRKSMLASEAERLNDDRVALSLALCGVQHAPLADMLETIKQLCDRAGFNPAERAGRCIEAD